METNLLLKEEPLTETLAPKLEVKTPEIQPQPTRRVSVPKKIELNDQKAFTKRLLDLTISLVMMIVGFPLMVFFALLVKLDSRGPAFYQQIRVGANARKDKRRSLARRNRLSASSGRRQFVDRRNQDCLGRPFPVLKFRTMTVDAEKNGPTWCQVDDPRITRIGRFLRKTHLDELPQLFNILRGDMSLVGPRPERPEFAVDLFKQIPEYRYRLVFKPGLTGLAQIRHRADLVIDDVKKKIRYDFLYMQRASLTTDLKIILGTVPMVLGLSLFRPRLFKKARRFFNTEKFLRSLEVKRVYKNGQSSA